MQRNSSLLILLILQLWMMPVYAQSLSKQEQLHSLLGYVVRANHFNTLYPQEKVYLHFDNTAYFSGETIWFCANVVGATASDTAFSKVLYVELLSPTGVVLQQQKLKIEEGRCHGAFPLVDASVKEANAKRGVLGYPSGYYEVRAYTRSMLNFDAHGCFSRVFPVYETPEKEGGYDNPIMKQYLRKEEIRPETKEAKELNIEFFPEGGHLIRGVENRIAFKAADSNGKGADVEELTIGGEHISISPQHRGMGYFMYTPKERRHKADVLYEGKRYTFSLPESLESGYALQVHQDMEDTLTVTINTLQPDTNRLLAVALMHAGKVHYIDTLTVNTIFFRKAISTAHFPTGTYQLCLFDADGVVHATRMLFCNNGLKEQTISITTSKPHYKPFEKIDLRIEMPTKEEQHVSLAVRDASDYGTGYSDDIRTYMLLSSELRGYIERPEYYFEADDEEHRKALDLLMMVQGWSRYNIEQMQSSIPPEETHYTEACLVLEGRALHPRRDEPMQGMEICIKLYSPDRQQVQEIKATSDEYGYWGVNLQDFEGEWDLSIQTCREGKPIVARLRLERSSAPEVLAYPLAALLPQYSIDTTDIAVGENVEEVQQLPESSILLDDVCIEGRRRYVDFCTFQAYNVAKDAELMIDKGEYTYTVADYLKDKGYELSTPKGSSFDIYYNAIRAGDSGQAYEHDNRGESANHRHAELERDSSDVRALYLAWLMRQAPINDHRTLWFIKYENQNRTNPSSQPGYEIDIAQVKSIIVYDTPHSYKDNPDVMEMFDYRHFDYVDHPYHGFPAGLYVVEICISSMYNGQGSWNKNARLTTFEGYSSEIEYYAPQYPNGPIQGDADYRRTLYWNPEVKISDGRGEVTFYNNSYSKHLHLSVEGLTRNGEFIVYDGD